jgi:nucleotide-binding universal stress UspA family protein
MKILVPTDFSDHSFYALKVAAKISKKVKSEINLVHITNSIPTIQEISVQDIKNANEKIKSFAQEEINRIVALDPFKNTNIIPYVLSNIKLWELLNDQRFKDADLIVIGSHGKGGINKLLIGSNAEKVIRLASCPVLTIKNDIDHFQIKRMVFASNFYTESYEVFDQIKIFAELYDAHIDLLKIITPKNFEPTPESLRLMNNFAKKFDLKRSAIHIYNAHSIEKGITDFCDEVRADLIAMETHGRTGLSHIINGSLAENVAVHEDRPVLSVKIIEIPENISGLKRYVVYQEKLEAESKQIV